MENANDKKINFILPGFLNISRNEILINIYEDYPNITMDNSCIHSFYGNFPSCIWNGGRLCLGERYTQKQMKKVREFHNKHGVAIALTMTNLCLEESHLDNKYGNEIMRIFHNGFNEVLVSSLILEKYIRKNYPKFKINKSITSTKKEAYNTSDYNLSVLGVRCVNDFKYIKNIPQNQRKKLEILCNEPCFNDCKYKYVHYEEINHIQLADDPPENEKHKYYSICRYGVKRADGFFYQWNKQTKFYVRPNDIKKKYLPLDINYFKINGREKNTYFGYENIVNYCLKSKYKNDVLCYMLERFVLEYEKEIVHQTKKYGLFAEENTREWHDRIDVYK